VLAILLILVSLMSSSTSKKFQRSQQEYCRDNLQKCYIALQIYANDHSGKLPEVAGAKTSEEPLALLVPRYTIDTGVFICPGTKDMPLPSAEPFTKRKISYAYYMGARMSDAAALMSDRQVDTSAKGPPGGLVFFPRPARGRAAIMTSLAATYCFADGRAEFSPASSAFSLALTNGVVLLNPKP